MSLVRAITMRHKKQPELQISSPIGHAASQRAGRPVPRAQISLPLTLVSTSNMLLNNAQDIAGTAPIDMLDLSPTSSSSSVNSHFGEDSDASSMHHSAGSITDASSVDESPISCDPEPNHLSCYFKPAVDTEAKSSSQPPSLFARGSFDAPVIPQRVPSHSKKAHEKLHRARSIQRLMSPPPVSAREARSSTDILTNASFVEAPKENPFGRELAQLDEVAEEFGHVVSDAETEDDLAAVKSRDLACFSASDYMSDIEDLIHARFHDEAAAGFAAWI